MSRLAALAAGLAACSAPSASQTNWSGVGYTNGYHRGPEVLVDGTGTARFAAPLLAAFDAEASMATVAFADRWYREPGNEGFEATLDHVLAALREAGFGAAQGYELTVHETPMEAPAWTPLRAELSLLADPGPQRVLARFGPQDDRDRTMLPVNAPSARVEGSLATSLEELDPGEILLTGEPLGVVLGDARAKGAAAVLSSHLRHFNVDPTGRERHLDAILYGRVSAGTTTPVANVSPRTHRALVEAAASGAPRLRLEAVVELAERPLRTLVATVVGAERPQEVVALVAHVQEPGANDNATGLAGLLEGALALRRAIESGAVPRPRRSVAFVWGDEFEASRVFLDRTERLPVAGISVDMIGASKSETGAICLLERSPDPGALTPLPPDEHTEWGAREVDPAYLVPNGLSVVMRTALVDVGLEAGGWESDEHPWEGGSDHDVFLGRGIPGALIWHFTDFTYHTSLDRLEMVDPRELSLTAVTLVVAACGVADARPEDMYRYGESLMRERYERQGAVVQEQAPEAVAEQWGEWSAGARRWFAALCNGLPLPAPLPLGARAPTR